jgi:hypothetical protein
MLKLHEVAVIFPVVPFARVVVLLNATEEPELKIRLEQVLVKVLF